MPPRQWRNHEKLAMAQGRAEGRMAERDLLRPLLERAIDLAEGLHFHHPDDPGTAVAMSLRADIRQALGLDKEG